VYGPVRTVVWQGSAGDCRPYADQTPQGPGILSFLHCGQSGSDHVATLAEPGRLREIGDLAPLAPLHKITILRRTLFIDEFGLIATSTARRSFPS
jgi:hypothetical protein